MHLRKDQGHGKKDLGLGDGKDARRVVRRSGSHGSELHIGKLGDTKIFFWIAITGDADEIGRLSTLRRQLKSDAASSSSLCPARVEIWLLYVSSPDDKMVESQQRKGIFTPAWQRWR